MTYVYLHLLYIFVNTGVRASAVFTDAAIFYRGNSIPLGSSKLT